MLTLRKYLLGLPSGLRTEIFVVLVQADSPHDSAEITLVPLGNACVNIFGSFFSRAHTFYNGPVKREISLGPRRSSRRG